MSEQQDDTSNAPKPPTAKPAPTERGDRMRRWRDVVEEKLAQARERGDFDNLPGEGQPLKVEVNVLAGDKALAYSLLKNNQVAPPEIERGKEIDADLARAEALLVELRARRDVLLRRATAAERRAYTLLRDKTEARYAETLRTTNSKILSFNIITPALLHRRMLDVERLMRAFQAEFPRLPE
jgi:hypothetical protein